MSVELLISDLLLGLTVHYVSTVYDSIFIIGSVDLVFENFNVITLTFKSNYKSIIIVFR